ncbi:MAG: GAF domain-containing protein [Anaerolineales bacterium]|nr:GAF domain-containing protein [Chloroflexota bacterium]MBL6979734.1 GAF domain-containing protein [Anaerolineales bacterium]
MSNSQDTNISKKEPTKSIAALQEQLMQGFMYALSIVGLLTAGVGSFEAIEASNEWLVPLYIISYLTVLLFTFWKKPSYRLRSWSLGLLLLVLGFTDFIADGLGGSGRLFLLGAIFITGILLGRRESAMMLIASTATMVGYGIVFSYGILTIPGEIRSSQPLSWVISTLALVMLQLLIHIGLNFLLTQFNQILGHSHEITAELQGYQTALEKQVHERTEHLSRRSAQLETTAAIGREITAIQDSDELLSHSVQMISEQLGYYHCAIYLKEKHGKHVVLKSASSEGGKQMLQQGYQQEIRETSIIGYVLLNGTARVAHDVDQDLMYLEVPELSDTKSELALPLRARDQLIGVLDVQSKDAHAFDDQDIVVLQNMADQLAMAIFNTQLYEESQANLRAARRAYRESSQKAWLELIQRKPLSKRYDPARILDQSDNWVDLMNSAAISGSFESEGNRLAIPLKDRGEIIGIIRAQKNQVNDVWNESELNMLNTLTTQLEVALESSRLFEDTQRRAVQEQLTSEITTRMRETLDMETVMKTAVSEIRTALGLSEVSVRLTPKTQKTNHNGEQ